MWGLRIERCRNVGFKLSEYRLGSLRHCTCDFSFFTLPKDRSEILSTRPKIWSNLVFEVRCMVQGLGVGDEGQGFRVSTFRAELRSIQRRSMTQAGGSRGSLQDVG